MTTSRAHAKQINKFKITRAHAIEMRNSDIGISKAELQKYIDNHDNLSGIIDSSSIISLKNLLIVDAKENSAENLKYSDIYQAIEVDLVLVESPSDCRTKFILTDIIIDFLRKKNNACRQVSTGANKVVPSAVPLKTVLREELDEFKKHLKPNGLISEEKKPLTVGMPNTKPLRFRRIIEAAVSKYIQIHKNINNESSNIRKTSINNAFQEAHHSEKNPYWNFFKLTNTTGNTGLIRANYINQLLACLDDELGSLNYIEYLAICEFVFSSSSKLLSAILANEINKEIFSRELNQNHPEEAQKKPSKKYSSTSIFRADNNTDSRVNKCQKWMRNELEKYGLSERDFNQKIESHKRATSTMTGLAQKFSRSNVTYKK